ncbi:unnamed protein product [Discosporangium mesarthrocarpum]
MQSRGIVPDLRAYNALVNVCADVGEFDQALAVVSRMVNGGVMGGGGRGAVGAVAGPGGVGIEPDAVTYTSLIKAAAKADPPRVKEAEEVCWSLPWHFQGIGGGGMGGGAGEVLLCCSGAHSLALPPPLCLHLSSLACCACPPSRGKASHQP